jgi:AraC-like DNA-binding protein
MNLVQRLLFCSGLCFTLSGISVPLYAADSVACAIFNAPQPGTILSSSHCTLSVSACPQAKVRTVTFRAHYNGNEEPSDTLTTLGMLTRPPYSLVWDLSRLPSQLLGGLSMEAEVVYTNNRSELLRHEGIFFLASQPQQLTQRATYAHTINDLNKKNSFKLSGPERSVCQVNAQVVWDKRTLLFSVDTKNPLFFADIPDELLRQSTTEIYIDVNSTLHPYPTESTLVVSVPLSGKPQRIVYKPTFDSSGGFQLITEKKPFNSPVSIHKRIGDGWRTECSIPISDLGSSIPTHIRANIIVSFIDESAGQQQAVTYSWVPGNAREIRSPLLFGSLELQRRSWYEHPALAWVGLFLGAFSLAFAAVWAITFKPSNANNHVKRFEASEEEKIELESIKEVVEREITSPQLTLHTLSQLTQLPPRRINTLLRKHQGMSFPVFVMQQRIEIVKERLRSSNSSETAIAKSTGFSSVEQMEKAFRRFYRTTPYNYRLKQQIS